MISSSLTTTILSMNNANIIRHRYTVLLLISWPIGNRGLTGEMGIRTEYGIRRTGYGGKGTEIEVRVRVRVP
jgi:hypothetical protein